jgi:hypothetical protein
MNGDIMEVRVYLGEIGHIISDYDESLNVLKSLFIMGGPQFFFITSYHFL